MNPRDFASFARRCHKPDHDRIGNWMARRISRPAALRVSWLLAPLGVTAHMATLAAWGCGLAAAGCFAGGSPAWWLAGAALLQLWYLLDHVDGQLARFAGTSSLDGVQLDYLMHHTINLLVPMGFGYGVGVASAQPAWLLAGVAWGLGLLLLGLQDDARYKAFILRLKRLEGDLVVRGCGGYRAVPQPPIPREPRRLARWLVHKGCEIHVVMNLLTVLAGLAWAGAWALAAAQVSIAVLGGSAVLLAVWVIARCQNRGDVEAEFARWFRLPPGHDLVYRDGWWMVLPCEEAQAAQGREDAAAGQKSS